MSGQRPDNNREMRVQSSRKPSESNDSGQVLATPESGLAKPVTPRPRRTTKPAAAKPTRTQPATASEEVTGIVGDASSSGTRSGEDVRKRGWFWHWNSIVTQYAPLIGLKGVGLLNSYTVWTDRREESPHRGYAFPSQQSEADFYGEDRAELIAINKILVALDLIEIRKEMVLRVDAQGRRWKVPHNLYRVKDHGDDTNLTTQDVLRVVELAEKDRAVYRHLRRMFSPRFDPIDGDNIWHQILPEVRATAAWQRLAAKTERDETKASARSKAGHAARRENAEEIDSPVFSLPESGDNPADEVTGTDTTNDSETVTSDGSVFEEQTSVAPFNRGSEVDVDPTNNGLADSEATSVADSNKGGLTNVARTNTTYNQSKTTTTHDADADLETGVRTERPNPVSIFSQEFAPDTMRSEAQAIRTFEEANDRKATAAERRQLRQLVERAATMGFSEGTDYWNLVSSTIEEAVSAGSSFVAPKRIREILIRWSRDGVPTEYARNVHPGRHQEVSAGRPVTTRDNTSHRVVSGVAMPNGGERHDVWGSVEQAVRAVLGAGLTDEIFRGTAIVGYDAGMVTILVSDVAQAEAFAGEHADLIRRKLGSALRRPVRLEVTIADGGPDGDSEDDAKVESEASREASREDLSEAAEASRQSGERVGRSVSARGGERTSAAMTLGAMPVFAIERCGMTNRQVWALALNDLREGNVIPRADVDAWLRDSGVLAYEETGEEGRIVLGVPHVLAARRIEGRFLAPIRNVLAAFLGCEGGLEIEVVLSRDWLRDTA